MLGCQHTGSFTHNVKVLSRSSIFLSLLLSVTSIFSSRMGARASLRGRERAYETDTKQLIEARCNIDLQVKDGIAAASRRIRKGTCAHDRTAHSGSLQHSLQHRLSGKEWVRAALRRGPSWACGRHRTVVAAP